MDPFFNSRPPQFGGIVAVKEIPLQNLGNTFNDYFSEAQAVFSSASANVVPVLYAGQNQSSKTICLVMPYFQKGSLADRVVKNPLALKDLLYIAHGILNGLGAIHGKGRIHFDVKPSNILFSDSNIAMVADFGQARTISNNGTVEVPNMYQYGLPPEFFETEIGTIRSDIYQVGITLYRCANGDPWFQNQLPTSDADLQDQTVAGKFPNRKTFLPHIPSRLRMVIRKALKTVPTERYSSAPNFAEALAKININMDWHTELIQNGEITWRAERLNQPGIRVRLLKDGKKWQYEMHTSTNGRHRAKSKEQWKRGLTRSAALRSLRDLFALLE